MESKSNDAAGGALESSRSSFLRLRFKKQDPNNGKIEILLVDPPKSPKPKQSSQMLADKKKPPYSPMMKLIKKSSLPTKSAGKFNLSQRQLIHGWWPMVKAYHLSLDS